MRDGAPGFKNGTPDVVLSGIVLQVIDVPTIENRAILEFDVTSFKVVDSVELRLHRFGSNGPYPFTLDVFGYEAAGSVTLADWNRPSIWMTSFAYTGEEIVRVDVAEFVQGLIAEGKILALMDVAPGEGNLRSMVDDYSRRS